MPTKRKKERIQVTLSPELLARLDAYCERLGVSRSAYLQIIVGQTLDSTDQMLSRVSDSMAAVGQDAAR